MWGFYAAFLALGVAHVRAAWRGVSAPALGRGARLLLALAVPVGLLGSILDCMGVSLAGCSPRCAFLTQAVVPAVGALAVLHGVTARSGWVVAALLLSFGLLVPNCVCRNPINTPWIRLIGLSPACFASGFTVTLVAASALLTRRHVRASVAFVWGTIVLLMVFFVGHHYFDWPW